MKKFFATLAVIGIVLISSCKKDKKAPPTAPVVTTAAVTNITINSATGGGSIVSDGGASITKSGVLWSKTNNTPTFADSIVAGTTATGTFTSNITGLDFNRTYYVRAFAINSVDTSYGNAVSFTTVVDTNKVRFTYNGQEVVYGIIISSASGKKWMDRNLGAAQVATAYDDYKGYGDLFQWGRPADGHQLINWTSSTTGTAVNGTTTVQATSDIPGHSNFIIPPYVAPWSLDWRNDNNRNRWATTPQGPCPSGWHVPTIAEWLAEVPTTNGGTSTNGGMTEWNSAYSKLKLTVGGHRIVNGPGTEKLNKVGIYGYYWTSTDNDESFDGYTDANRIVEGVDGLQQGVDLKGAANSVRCIHD